jgi:fatty acid desaturase
MGMMTKDYGLLGPTGLAAQQSGLSSGNWYACAVPRKQLKELMRRKDGPAIRDTLIWFASLALFGGLGTYFWGTWWAVPCFLVYGVLYCSASDSRWHECGHGTAFKTRWMNAAVYHIACFFILREPTVWRWSHARHHTDTIIVGRDPEIAVPRPPDILGIVLNLFQLRSGVTALRNVLLHTTGRLTPEERSFIPEMEWPKVFVVARVWTAIFLGVIALAVATRSLLPLVLVGLPSFYGAWLFLVFGLTQHSGLAEDVLDHRLNSRTVYMNPIFRFIYWNMNYHVEHHMFPMVPYHALPRLHAAVKADTPKPYNGLWEAYREIIPAILRQRREPTYFVRRDLPRGARPMEMMAAQPLAAE